MSPGNFTNTARRGHSNSVLPVAFLPIPKSKHPDSSRWLLIECDLNCSKQIRGKASGVSAICAPHVPHVFSVNLRASQGINDRTWSCSLPWWPFSTCYLLARSLHRRLSRTSMACGNCSMVVSKVRIMQILQAFFVQSRLTIGQMRCAARKFGWQGCSPSVSWTKWLYHQLFWSRYRVGWTWDPEQHCSNFFTSSLWQHFGNI